MLSNFISQTVYKYGLEIQNQLDVGLATSSCKNQLPTETNETSVMRLWPNFLQGSLIALRKKRRCRDNIELKKHLENKWAPLCYLALDTPTFETVAVQVVTIQPS